MLSADPLYLRSTVKSTRLFTFHLVCLTVIFTFLANIARAEDVMKTTKAQTKQSQSALSIQFANDLLTVDAKDVPLRELLQEIAGQSGLSVEGSGSLEDRVTIQFDQLALDEGIRMILRRHSFALVYAQKTPERSQTAVLRLETLRIFSKGEKGFPIKTTVVDSNRRKDSLKNLPRYPLAAGGAYK